ncbi:hypothetical protein GCK72_003348 [Caenorhabditis remanei]|uniref:Uncharacterized protein n=1 Tax=Caenorhabditis remanei TaxID=31234 RepID=A0A6A5HW87_CAERE|nr:hypothetical protein GCK72_003348 [Caenorhabditis remanei]KAF1771521.1 hypothetical protein GCK72_003348 [Caenorhabditis remanei]
MVVLYLYLLIIGANGEAKKKSGGRLTPEENKQRLETCGKTAIDTPSGNSTSMELLKSFPDWLSWAITRNQNSGAALTTMISPRHFLTSSQVVMHDNATWRWSSKKVRRCSHELGQVNLEVPKEILKNLELFKTECPPTCKITSVIPVTRAVILNYCYTTSRMWQWSQAVMVMEIAEDISDGGFPCLTYEVEISGAGEEAGGEERDETYERSKNEWLSCSRRRRACEKHGVFPIQDESDLFEHVASTAWQGYQGWYDEQCGIRVGTSHGRSWIQIELSKGGTLTCIRDDGS